MSLRGKTVKRSSTDDAMVQDPIQVSQPNQNSQNQQQSQQNQQNQQQPTENSSMFLQFLESNANTAFKRPWHRLERGLRLNRLRKFADDETARFNLNEVEQARLFQVLLKALDKKLLNSKLIVNYDMDKQQILEIKGLIMHRLADGSVNFQLSDRKAGSTVKRRPVETSDVQQGQS